MKAKKKSTGNQIVPVRMAPEIREMGNDLARVYGTSRSEVIRMLMIERHELLSDGGVIK